MKILSFNMCYGAGVTQPRFFLRYITGRSSMTDEIAAFVRSVDPDVLAATEVDRGDQNFLPAATVFSSVKYAPFYKHIPFLRKNHNAVFLKAQDVPCYKHYFCRGFKRLVLQTRIRPDVDLFLVHLSLRKKTRSNQLAELSELLAGSPRQKIVTGDFNTFGGIAELATFMQRHHLRSVNTKNHATFPSWKPKHELDFFLVSPGLTVKRFEVLHTALSDHLPIFLEIV